MNKIATVSIILSILFLLIGNVYAQPEDVSLPDIPQHLADALGMPLYAGKLLTCAIFVFMFLFPTVIAIKRHVEYIIILEGILLLGFFIAVGWLEYWYILVYVLTVAALWGVKMKGLIY